MLIVKTKIKLSKGKGLGLFADQNIKKGDIVAIDKGLEINKYSAIKWALLKKKLSPESFKQIKKYAFKNKEDGLYWLFLDDTRFVNHSKNYNFESVGNRDIASKNIKKGEELLIDYTTFYDRKYFKEIMKIK